MKPCSPCCALCASGDLGPESTPSLKAFGPRGGRGLCVCGCGHAGRAWHHVVYQQHIRAALPRVDRSHPDAKVRRINNQRMLDDRRNLVPVTDECHARHHSGFQRLRVAALPDCVFAYAADLFGAPAAYEYLRRYYRGEDARLDVLLEVAA